MILDTSITQRWCFRETKKCEEITSHQYFSSLKAAKNEDIITSVWQYYVCMIVSHKQDLTATGIKIQIMIIFLGNIAEKICEQSTMVTQLTAWIVWHEDGVLPSVSGTKITEIFVVIARHKPSLLESYAN